MGSLNDFSKRQHTAYVSMCQHTAYVSMCQHTSYVNIEGQAGLLKDAPGSKEGGNVGLGARCESK